MQWLPHSGRFVNKANKGRRSQTVAGAHINVEERYYNMVTLSNRAMLGDNRRSSAGKVDVWRSLFHVQTQPKDNQIKYQKLQIHILQQNNLMHF